jgi:hypothetical protein
VRRLTPVNSLAVLLVSASLLLAGCGGDDKPEPQSQETGPSGQQIASGAEIDQTWPLTGLTAKSGQSVEKTHPVMVLKMDNTYSSAPQKGLSHADLVVEELVEGGLTRLAAFYYSDIPGVVGPVRSMRASDIGIVSPVGADVVTSGAAPVTIRRITGAGIKFFGEGAKGFARDTSRVAPYNLMANLTSVVSTIKQKPERPDDYLPWGDESDFAQKGPVAHKIATTFGGGHTTNWTYNKASGTYTNLNTYAAQGDEFKPDTVLVLRVPIGDAGYKDPAGNPVPETKLMGKGPAMVFHDGRMMKATWHKDALDSALSFSTKKGEVKIPAGHVWLELVPAADGAVSFTK